MVKEVDIRRIAMSMPGAYEQASYEGQPSWRTKPRMFAWLRQDPEALVAWVESVEAKEAMIAMEPERYFTTPHYDGYAIMLVRPDAVDRKTATELIEASWRLRAPASFTRPASRGATPTLNKKRAPRRS